MHTSMILTFTSNKILTIIDSKTFRLMCLEKACTINCRDLSAKQSAMLLGAILHNIKHIASSQCYYELMQ